MTTDLFSPPSLTLSDSTQDQPRRIPHDQILASPKHSSQSRLLVYKSASFTAKELKKFLNNLGENRLHLMRAAIAKEREELEAGGAKMFFKRLKTVTVKVASFLWLLCPPLPSCTINKLAFMPPRPSYRFLDSAGKRVNLGRLDLPQTHEYYEIEFIKHNPVWEFGVKTPNPETTDYFFARSKHHVWIACAFVRCEAVPTWTLLLSHQNATDIGYHLCYFPGIQAIADVLRCNICCYDYAGYGQSGGHASESRLYADIRAVFDELGTRYGIGQRDVVLWGYSLGTAASVDLAAHLDGLAGLVLTAPFSSALRMVFACRDPSSSCTCDKFTSIEKITSVRALTLIFHGKEDAIVPVAHAEMLQKRCPNTARPCFIDEAGHNDIEWYDEYWSRLHRFINEDLVYRHRVKFRELTEPLSEISANYATTCSSLLELEPLPT